MARNQFDPTDIGLLVAGILASGVMVGIVTVEAFNYSMADALFSVGSADVTLAYLVSVATLGGILVTNDNTDLLAADGYDKLKNSGMADYYTYLILGGVAVLVGWLFVPEIAEFFLGSDVWGSLYIVGMAGVQVALGWMY